MSAQPTYLELTDKLTSLTLESVKVDFLNWRRDAHSGSRIPEPLWDKVIQLLLHHSKSKVLSSLGVSHSQLAQKLKSRQKTSIEQTTIDHTFVKAIVAVPTQVTTCFDVVLTKPNGATLQIQKLSPIDMLKLTEQFIG